MTASTPPTPSPARRRWLRRGAIALALVATYALLLGVLVPYVLHARLPGELSARLGRPVELDALELDPFDLRVEVRGLRVVEPSGKPLVGWAKLVVDVAALRSLGGQPTLEALTLDAPLVTIELLPGGRLNFTDILERNAPATPPPPSPEPPGPPPVVRVDRLAITGGALDFTDRRTADVFQAELAPFSIELDDFTTEPAQNNAYAFLARFGEGSSIGWDGDFSLSPVRSKGQLVVEGISLAPLAPYLKSQMRLRLASGVVGLRANYVLDLSSTPGVTRVERAGLTLRDLSLLGPEGDAPVFTLGALNLSGVDVDANGPDVKLADLAVSDVSVKLTREPSGAIDLVRWLAPSDTPAPAKTTTATAAPTKSTLRLALERVGLGHVRVDFTDRTTPTPARFVVDQLGLSLGRVTLPELAPLALQTSMRVDERARLRVEGTIDPTPAAAHALSVKLEDFALPSIQPYLARSLNGALSRGRLDATLDVATRGPGNVTARGGIEARELVIDDAAGKPVVSFARLALRGLDADVAAARTHLDAIELGGLRVRYELLPGDTNNLAGLSRPAPKRGADATAAEPAPQAAPGPAPRLDVGRLALDDAGIDVFDRTIAPNVAVKLSKLAVKLAPLTMPIEKRIAVDVSGRLDAAPLTVKGVVLPRGKQSFVDLTVALRGWDLAPLSPYMGKYAGYPITKGKLTLDLVTKVADKRLDATNHALVDQLELGDKTDSPDATWLPVKLALAILTDRNGRIEIDLPASGDLDDPEFGVGKLVWKTLLNVLEKVATSPFALLGSLLGGSTDDLDHVSFAVGEAALGPEASDKVAKLTKALVERPRLTLSVGGQVEAEGDRRALARAKLTAQLVDEKRRRLVATKKLAPSAPAPALEPGEYEARVAELYATLTRGGTVRPRLLGARTSSAASGAPASADEMERAALATVEPTEAELVALRDARAKAVQAKLLEAEGVGAERVFLVAPKPEDAERAARATMTLQ
jgi:hypothetical protein